MTPRDYEEVICLYFRKQGYKANCTACSGDYGIDVFAVKGEEMLAIQAKMYGASTRKVNRQMIMELHGAKDYFDCTKAILVTNGEVLPDAIQVAEKLNIEILYFFSNEELVKSINYNRATPSITNNSTDIYSFDYIWDKYIMPLKGKTIKCDRLKNKILDVDWTKITRITSTGRIGTIKIEIFKQTINTLLKEGHITRDEINQNYVGRASSGVVLILSQVPFIEVKKNPTELILKANYNR